MSHLEGYSDRSNHQKKMGSLAILSIFLVALIVYINSISNEFVMDDLALIAQNLTIRKLSNAWDLLISSYRPVRYISWALDYALWGLNPAGYHLTNMILHAFSSLFAYLITCKITRDYRIAFFTGILFAVHPIHTEAVTYLSGRRDVLSAFFYLMAFYYFLRYRENRKKRFFFLLSGAFTLGLLSKEMAASFPILLIGYDTITDFRSKYSWFNRRYFKDLIGAFINILRTHYIFYGFQFFIVILSVYYYVNVMHASTLVTEQGVDWWGGSIPLNFMNSAYVYTHYVKKLFFPIVLVADNDVFPIIRSFLDVKVLIPLGFLPLVLVLFLKWIQHKKIHAFCLAWFTITLLPVMHIIPHHELLAEHYLYLPSYACCLIIGVGLQWLGKHSRKLSYGALVLFAMISILFSLRTIVRNLDWRNEFTIYQKDLMVYPDNGRVHVVLGKAYMDASLYDYALKEFDLGYNETGVFTRALAYKSHIYYMRGEYDKAIEEAELALEIQEEDFTHLSLGKYFQTQGEDEKALFHFLKVGPGKHQFPALIYSYQIYQSQWDQKHADQMADAIIQESERMLNMDLHNQEVLMNLARAYEWQLRFEDSIQVYLTIGQVSDTYTHEIQERIRTIQKEKRDFFLADELLKKNPEEREGLLLMGKAHYAIRRYGDAIGFFDRITGHDDIAAEAYYLKARMYNLGKKFHQAMIEINHAIARKQDLPEYYFLRGILYAQNLDFDPAIREFDRARSLGMHSAELGQAYEKALQNKKRYDQYLFDKTNELELIRVYIDYSMIHEAVSMLSNIEKTIGEETKLLFQIALLYEEMGSHYTADALRVYRKLVQLNSEDVQALTKLGYLHWNRTKDFHQVISLFKRSIALDPLQEQAAEMEDIVKNLSEYYMILFENTGIRISGL